MDPGYQPELHGVAAIRENHRNCGTCGLRGECRLHATCCGEHSHFSVYEISTRDQVSKADRRSWQRSRLYP